MQNENQQDPRLRQGSGGQATEIQLEPKLHPHTHKILWAVVGVLLLVVIVGTYFWWQEIKRTAISEQETIAGIDADNNGVWDYVDEYIANTYPNEPAKQAALKQLAETNQQFMLAADDASAVLQIVELRHAAQDCLYYVNGGNIQLAADQRIALRSVLMNTPERSKAYLKADTTLSGQFFAGSDPEKWRERCNFDPDTISETSTWKTYSNTKYGFEFKYPNRLEVAKFGNSIIYIAEDESKASIGDGVYITRVTPEASAQGNKNSGLEFGKIEKISQNQINWEKVYSENKNSGTTYVTYSTNKDGYIIAFNSGREQEDTIDQILSTFKFTK